MNRSKDDKVSQSSRFAFTLASRGKKNIRITRQADIDPLPFKRVKLNSINTKDEVGESWKTYSLGQEMKYEERNRTLSIRRSNRRGISALSRRLISLERARALGRKPVNPQVYVLELEARRWTQERAKRKQEVG